MLERDIRRKNIVIRGLQDKHMERVEEREEAVLTILKRIGVDKKQQIIDRATRIGVYGKDKSRPVLVNLMSEKTKREILANAKQLKGTDI